MILRHKIIDGKLHSVNNENEASWIEVINPSEKEIVYIISTYNLPPDYLLDVNDPYEVPRVEGLEDERPNLFVLSYPIKKSEGSYDTRVVSIVVIDDLVITVRNEHSKVFDMLKDADFKKINEEKDYHNFAIVLAFIVSKSYIDIIKDINSRIEIIEGEIKESSKPDLLYNLIDIHKSLINFKVGIEENNAVIKGIFDLETISKSIYKDELLHDLLVENKQARTMILKSTTMVDNLSNLYTNVISNNLNDVMKVLTSITIVMTIPTIIGGIYGMNVSLPFENHRWAFWIIIAFTSILSLIIIKILKKNRYL